MTRNENLLITAAEECAEIQQAISKAMRFGMDFVNPVCDNMSTNMHNILTEYYQLTAVMGMLFENNILTDLSDEEKAKIIHRKKDKVQFYQTRSKDIGLITD